MIYEPLGFVESGVTYHICADKKTVTIIAKKGAVEIKCTGVTFKGTIEEAKSQINNELHSKNVNPSL